MFQEIRISRKNVSKVYISVEKDERLALQFFFTTLVNTQGLGASGKKIYNVLQMYIVGFFSDAPSPWVVDHIDTMVSNKSSIHQWRIQRPLKKKKKKREREMGGLPSFC